MRRAPLLVAVEKGLRVLGRPSAGETVVVGLSGGPDSVALLDVLVSLGRGRGFRVVAAHLDHALRPSSGEDAVFCRTLCERMGVGLHTKRADVRGRAGRDGGGLEEAARLERYAFLRAVREAEKAELIAVAHNRDDQAETFLLRLLRGAGSVGLSAMRPLSGDVLRPLLDVPRREILAHLESRGLSFREDPTNADLALLRNRLRHELIPYLESRFNPRIREALARAAGLAGDEADALATLGGRLLPPPLREGDLAVLSSEALRRAPRPLARVAVRQALAEAGGLRGIAHVHIERILDLACSTAPSGRRVPLPGGREGVFSFGDLRLGPRAIAPCPFAVPLPVPGEVELPGGLAVVARSAPGPAVSNEKGAVVAAPGRPLVVRTRRPGDRVRTRGREVSLKRFFMDRRVPVDDRARLPLVAAGSRVLWVPGHQTDAAAAGRGRRFVRLELRRAGPLT